MPPRDQGHTLRAQRSLRHIEVGRPSWASPLALWVQAQLVGIGVAASDGGPMAPTHAALTAVVKRVERGEMELHPRNIEGL